MKNNTLDAFFALVKAGLWEKEVALSEYGEIDYNRLLQLAEEQSVVGLVAAGLEHVVDVKVSKEIVLQFVGQTLQLEQQNTAMNYFIGVLVDKMRKDGIYTLLLKGQGIAQCYERPLWRANGDVDFFLSEDNYESAKQYLTPLAKSVETEGQYKKHLGMTIDPWVVELHGNLRSGLSSRVDRGLDEIKNDVFYGGNVRSWTCEGTQVFLMSANNDAIYVFSHILHHFYRGGIGLRQICDWIRLLWTYRDKINMKVLEQRIRKMGLMTEWKAFGSLAVDYLGMPSDAMPLYSPEGKWRRKAQRICSFILTVGNFGHNRDLTYYSTKPYIIQKMISFGQRIGDLCAHIRIFPVNSMRFFPSIVINGLRSAMNGE